MNFLTDNQSQNRGEKAVIYFSLTVIGVLLIFSFFALFIKGAYKYYSRDLPEDVTVSANFYPQTSQILSRRSKLLYRYVPTEERRYVKLSQLPQDLTRAFLAIEDHRFFKHSGISFLGLGRAALTDISQGRLVEGGSTITQQLARNLFLNSKPTFSRKIKEMILARRLEKNYHKREILELYLNKISFGSNIHGVEVASLEFFGKHASDLNLAESAVLAAMPKAPSSLSPQDHKRKLLQRQKLVLERMRKMGYINKKEFNQAKTRQVNFKSGSKPGIKAPHFIFFVLDKLRNVLGQDALREGLEARTTLDLSLQKKAQKLVGDYVKKRGDDLGASNAALVAIDAQSGELRAMVGSRNFWGDKFGQYNAARAQRQPGSTLKPLIYTFAFEKLGLDSRSRIRDVPTKFGSYFPQNFDRRFHGVVTAKQALIYSYNIPAVKLLNRVGVDRFRERISKCGLDLKKGAGLSLALGGAAVKLYDLTGAYSIFPNQGECKKKKIFYKVKNRTTEKNYDLDRFNKDSGSSSNSEEKSLFSSKATAEADEILKQLKKYYPGKLGRWTHERKFKDAAFKTGTSDNARDAWTIGYSDDIIVGVWVGNNDNSSLSVNLALEAATPLWKDFMDYYLSRNAENRG